MPPKSSVSLSSEEAFFNDVCNRARQMLATDAPAREVLACLVTAAEVSAGSNSVCSILRLDEEGLLRNGASPNLPADYLNAIDRIKPDPNLGTCASAAATGTMVITQDFHEDNKWAELRHLPLALGFVGAWSMPIKDHAGTVLGTFGTYFREKRSPSSLEIKNVQILSTIAAQVMGKAVSKN